jgi:hypothetical protein
MTRVTSALGYTAAVLTLVAAILTPFVLTGAFTKGVAALGLQVDPVYLGGREVRSVSTNGYRIAINEVVRPKGLWPQAGPFVQLAWSPATALPSHVADEVDVDGDGRADALVSFDVPRDPGAPLAVDIVARTPMLRSVKTTSSSGAAFVASIVRVRDSIVVRVPLAK